MVLLLIRCGTSNESNNATDMERTSYVSLNNLNGITMNVLEETISSLELTQKQITGRKVPFLGFIHINYFYLSIKLIICFMKGPLFLVLLFFGRD